MNTIKVLLTCVFVFSAFFISSAQVKKEPKRKVPSMLTDWHLRSFDADGVYGAEVIRAYEYLKGRQPKARTVVGIVDGGVEIDHEDLKGALWVNEGEIPGNGMDDDGNGYADDVHGWNFLGTPDGKQLEIGYSVADKEYMRLFSKYEGVDTTRLSRKEKKEYLYFQDVCKFSSISRAYRQIASAEVAVKYAEVFQREMAARYPDRKHFLLKHFADLLEEGEKDTERVKAYHFFREKWSKDPMFVWSQKFYEGREKLIDEAKADYEKRKVNYAAAEKARKALGDDPENIKDRFYGNNNLAAGSALHGMHVGGIVGATRNNGIGVDGVADAALMFLRVGEGSGDEHDKEVALCIRYAVDHGARVINMSFGKPFSPHNEWMVKAMQYAEKKGVLLVHAAGNDGESLDTRDRFPGRNISGEKMLKNWIAVGSIAMNGEPALSSNYGKREVDLFAPGVNIYSTVPGNKYRTLSGTSMATPVVTGVIALIWNYFPELTVEEVKQAVLGGVTVRKGELVNRPGSREKVDFGELCITGGILNALEAVKLAEKIYMEKLK